MADVVGYWAEAKIFGGVVVFDRGPSGTEVSLVAPESHVLLPLVSLSLTWFLFPASGKRCICMEAITKLH